MAGPLTEQDWNQLRLRLGDNPNSRVPAAATRVRTYLLTGGIAICGRCGNHLHAHTRGSGVRSYNCMSGPDKDGCGGVTCSAKALDGLVVNAVLTHDETACARELPSPTVNAMSDAAVPSRSQQGIAELANLFARGHLSETGWRIARAGIASVEAQPDDASQGPTSTPHPAVIEQWAQLPLEHRRKRITDVLEQVVVDRPITKDLTSMTNGSGFAGAGTQHCEPPMRRALVRDCILVHGMHQCGESRSRSE